MRKQYNVTTISRQRRIGRTLTTSLACLTFASITLMTSAPLAAATTATEKLFFNIRADNLEGGLLSFADQAGVQLAMQSSTIRGLKARALNGHYTRSQALAALIGDANVTAEWTSPFTVAIRPVSTPRPRRVAMAMIQPAGSDPAPAAVESSGLEDIIVTAQRREERLQDVPVAVTVASAAQMNLAGNTVDSLGKVASSINLTQGGGPINLFIRGIGNYNDGAGNEGSGAVYIDGVYVARSPFQLFSFPDIERVEVLKGPQGTLFGRNSSAGLVNFVTRTPTDTPMFEGSVGYGNYDTIDINAYGSTPLTDGVAMSLAGFYNDQNEGWGRDTFRNKDVFYGRRWGLHSKLLAELTPSTKITLGADYTYGFLNRPLTVLEGSTFGNPPGEPPAVYTSPGFFNARQETPATYKTKSYGFTGRLDQDLGFADFVSLSGYRNTHYLVVQDSDLSPAPVFVPRLNNKAHQFSQEFQLLSHPGSPVKYVLGLYYLNAVDGYQPYSFLGSIVGPGISANTYVDSEVKSYAAFGQATFDLTEKLSFTGGLRYTIDDARLRSSANVTLIGSPTRPETGAVVVDLGRVDGDKTFRKLTWRGTLEYRFNDDVMTYASISRGYKAGLFQTLPPKPTPILPETTDSYELGFKTELFDRKVRLNGALFWTEVKDPQISFIRANSVDLANAGHARSRGAEVEIDWAVDRNLKLRFSGTYLDAQYTSFPNAPYNAPNTGLVNGIVPGCTTPATVNTDPANGGNVEFCSGSAKGNRLARAPKVSFVTGFDYTIPVGPNALTLSTNLSYNGGFFWEPENTYKQKAYALLDAQLAYKIGDGRYSISIWGRNIANERYLVCLYEQASFFGYPACPGAPRSYGATLGVKF